MDAGYTGAAFGVKIAFFFAWFVVNG